MEKGQLLCVCHTNIPQPSTLPHFCVSFNVFLTFVYEHFYSEDFSLFVSACEAEKQRGFSAHRITFIHVLNALTKA